MTNKPLIILIRWLIIIAMPFFLGLGTIRVVIAWWDYPSFEYQRIPPDRFGFTPEQRLELAQATLAYMRQSEPAEEVIYILEDLRLPGSDTPLYNEREISHMLDVKIVADAMKNITIAAMFIVVGGLTFFFVQPTLHAVGYRTLMHSGIATVSILLLIALFILLAWNTFFVQFHELLFPPDTWTFSYSDSLIRLFPEQFWFDIGVILSLTPLVQGIIITVIGYFLTRTIK